MDRVGHVTDAIELLNSGDIVAGMEGYAENARSCVSALGVDLAGREAIVLTMGRFVQEADVRYELDRVRAAMMLPMAVAMRADEVREFLMVGTRTGKLTWTAPIGQPHVAPIWFMIDDGAAELEVVFNAGKESAKGRALERDPRVSLLVDGERPTVRVRQAERHRDDQRRPRRGRPWARRIGGRYMGADRADEFGRPQRRARRAAHAAAPEPRCRRARHRRLTRR